MQGSVCVCIKWTVLQSYLDFVNECENHVYEKNLIYKKRSVFCK